MEELGFIEILLIYWGLVSPFQKLDCIQHYAKAMSSNVEVAEPDWQFDFIVGHQKQISESLIDLRNPIFGNGSLLIKVQLIPVDEGVEVVVVLEVLGVVLIVVGIGIGAVA